VSDFLGSKLEWSIRKGTRAARHIPENAQELCEEAAMHFVSVITEHNIPGDLIVGMDQQGITILIGNDCTYDKKGAKQVDIAAHDERRAYTLCVASTAAGSMLPFQQVWARASEASLPKKNLQKPVEEAKGFCFAFAKSKKQTSHFSTLKTMQEVCMNSLDHNTMSH
jgi:hypothetical protein